MTPKEILHKIVETEDTARVVYQETATLQQNFEEYVNNHVEVIRNERFSRAEKAISDYAVEEKKRADETLLKLDEKFKEQLSLAKAQHEDNRAATVDKIFKLAVNIDA